MGDRRALTSRRPLRSASAWTGPSSSVLPARPPFVSPTSGGAAAVRPRDSRRAAKMSERRRSAVALSSRAHAFSVEALIGSNKKRKLRDWDDKGLDLSMESLSPEGQLPDADDTAQCLDLNAADTAGGFVRRWRGFRAWRVLDIPSDSADPAVRAMWGVE
ncbi:hypothetical protein lerEdw1_020577 [Lerista edwardsae]|nr:hypothetical protein lerEdw1_020577 [Lerista edwardsae]